jgi:UDP-glucose 4-epimerase
MNILILGGHGFIGHNKAKRLIDLGHQVHIVDLHHQYNEYPDWEYQPVLKSRIDHIGPHHSYFGDVANHDFMTEVFSQARPQRVIDLATYPNAKMVQKNVVDATVNMIAATAIALDLCVTFSVERFVLASSSMVYGDFGRFQGPPREDADCNPLTLYGSYKLQCERMCKIWREKHGLDYVLLRPSALYGVRDMVVRVISKMTVDAVKRGQITVQGPTNKLDFSNVIDVAEAFVQAAVHADVSNQIFNCTRNRGRTILEAAEIIQSRIPCRIDLAPHNDFYPSRDTLDSSRLSELTDWKPTIDIEQGIVEYLDWFLSQNYLSRF